MKKVEVVSRLMALGFLPIIRAPGSEVALEIAAACQRGGAGAVEITLTVPGATEVIADLTRRDSSSRLLVGAGTVLDPETARLAIMAGARFVVSPALSTETARMCNRYGVAYIPGAMTVGEVIASLEAGADIIKVFPGASLGPDFIRAVLGPLPHASLMPTSGVELGNVAAWIHAGAVAVGVGRNVTAGADDGDFRSVTDACARFIEAVERARA